MKFTVGEPLTLDQLAYVADLERKVADRRVRIAELEKHVADLDARPSLGSHATLVRRERRARQVAARLRAENTRLRALLRTAAHPEEIPMPEPAAALPKAGDEFTDDQGETRVVAAVEQHHDELIIHDSFGDAVIVPLARFEEEERG